MKISRPVEQKDSCSIIWAAAMAN